MLNFEWMFIFAPNFLYKICYLKLFGTLSKGSRSSRTFTVMEMVP